MDENERTDGDDNADATERGRHLLTKEATTGNMVGSTDHAREVLNACEKSVAEVVVPCYVFHNETKNGGKTNLWVVFQPQRQHSHSFHDGSGSNPHCPRRNPLLRLHQRPHQHAHLILRSRTMGTCPNHRRIHHRRSLPPLAFRPPPLSIVVSRHD